MSVTMENSTVRSLKRPYTDFVSQQNSSVGCASMNTLENRKKMHAVSDVLVRQKLLTELIRAQCMGKVHEAFALSEHAADCSNSGCSFEGCTLAKKCLLHYRKCKKQECIACVEARLSQVIDSCTECTEEEKFVFSAWRARLQSVNDETKEYVPYFNSCAKELLVARTTRSPFVQAAKDRFASAQLLVNQSEKRYAELCMEIYSRWVQLRPTLQDDSGSSDAGSGEETASEGKSSPTTQIKKECKGSDSSDSSWHNPVADKPMRLEVLERIFVWSKTTNPNALLLGEKVLLDGARKAESLLYTMSRSRDEYEREAERMCEGNF